MKGFAFAQVLSSAAPSAAALKALAAAAASASASAPSSAAAAAGGGREQGRRHAAQQLLALESSYARALAFGVRRFLEPLAGRRDVLSPTDHQTLFQNIQEVRALLSKFTDNT